MPASKRFIPLTQGLETLVDEADFAFLSQWKWHARRIGKCVYAYRSDGMSMHRLLLPGFPMVDHKDGDGLNNRRNNLRPSNNQKNHQGFQHRSATFSSKFRGVYWNKRKQKWHTFLEKDGRRFSAGYHPDEVSAAVARDKRAIEVFGPDAFLNFPLS